MDNIKKEKEKKDDYNKVLLSQFQLIIEEIFELYKTKNKFMGVYFTNIDRPFITFKSLDLKFNDRLKIGKKKHRKGFIYNTSLDFNTQTSIFLK